MHLYQISNHKMLIFCPVEKIKQFKQFQVKDKQKAKSPPLLEQTSWSGLRGSNSLPPPWQGGALPDELNPHNIKLKYCLHLEIIPKNK